MPLTRLGRQGWWLLAILAAACVARLATIRFGLPALNDPDELMFEMGALRMLRGPTLDPGWFGHPATTTMYLLALVDAGVFGFALVSGRVASARQFGEMVYADPSWIILPGRVAMLLVALATIALTWRLATRLFGREAGWVAALLLAINPVHLAWSTVIRSDIMACLFMLLCLEACIAVAECARARDYRRAAVWLGLAVATKWPFALSFLAIGGATLHALRTGTLPRRTAARRLAGAGLTALAVLFLASPFLLVDYPTVVRNLQGEGQARHLGATGGSAWFDLLWYLQGPLLGGFGVLGLALVAYGALRLPRRPVAFAILAPVSLGFVVILCAQALVWERWALPLMPLGAMVASWGFVRFARALSMREPRVAAWAPAVLILAMAVPLAVRGWSDGQARMDDTRQRASAWARAHIPPGSRVLVEHYAFDLVREPWQLLFPIGDAGCVDAVALLHGRTSYAVIERARAGRSNVDYGTMAPTRRADCHADFAILAQYDRYRQERDRFPAEYAAYRWLLAHGRIVAIFKPEPGRVGGYTVTIVDLRSS